MLRVFFDSSALFAAAYSPDGASGELLRLSLRGQVRVVVSRFVLDEVERNLAEAVPGKLPAFWLLVELLDFEIAPEPTRDEVLAAASYVALKDASVVAAAINARPAFLTTFDRKHLLNPPEVAARSGLRIVLPEVALHAVREQDRGGAEGAEAGK